MPTLRNAPNLDRRRNKHLQFHFSNHVLDGALRELTRDGETIAVEPQVFDLLVYLVENRDRVVSKDDLIETIWEGRIVSKSTLTSRINAARKAVGDNGKDQAVIRTIAKKGFRFVGGVSDTLRRTIRQLLHRSRNRPAGNTLAGGGHECRSSRRSIVPPSRCCHSTGEPEQNYFSEGISEDIITALSKLRWFYVIARNSSFVYKGKAVHLKQIGEELGVGYVVQGSVRKVGDRIRITAQLNDVVTGSHLWAERYDRNLADVFAVQDEITQAVVAAIEPQLYAAEDFRARRKTPDNMDAWDLVMRALSHYWRVTRQDNLVAQALLEKAIAVDPGYGQALSLLAACHTWSAHMGWEGMPEAVAVAERAALAAIRADSEDAWAHYALAIVYLFNRRFDDSIAEFELALQLNPNFSPGARTIWRGAGLSRALGGRRPRRARGVEVQPARPVRRDLLRGGRLLPVCWLPLRRGDSLVSRGLAAAKRFCWCPPRIDRGGSNGGPRRYCESSSARSSLGATYHLGGLDQKLDAIRASCRS